MPNAHAVTLFDEAVKVIEEADVVSDAKKLSLLRGLEAVRVALAREAGCEEVGCAHTCACRGVCEARIFEVLGT